MAKKIGEALIDKGLINRKQLNQALKYQLIVGGHLGTSLIELGLVDEDALGNTLAELLGLRYADAEVLRNIPRSVIHRVRPELVEQHQVVPIRLRGRTLHLAVISSSHVTSLSSRTGYKVVPWIAPEVRILEAMERYYNIPRRARYLGIAAAMAPARSAAPIKRPLMDGSLSPVDQSLLHAIPNAYETDLSPESTDSDYSESWHDVAERLFGADPHVISEQRPAVASSAAVSASGTAVAPHSPAAVSPGAAVEVSPTPERRAGLEEVAYAMSQADSREELVSTLLSWLEPSFPACMLFGVKPKAACIWDWRGIELSPDKVIDLEFPVPSGSVFELLLGNDSYHGPVPDSASCRKFYASLHRHPPEQVLLHPIYLQDRLVAILYGEGETSTSELAASEPFQQVIQKFSLALHMVILKRKIRAAD